MDLINEKHAWNEFGDSLIDISVHDLVNFTSEFVGDFGFLRLHDLTHQAHEVVSTLWFGIGHIEIMETDILDDFLLFVDVTLWQWDVFFCLQIVFAGICVTSSDSFNVSSWSFDVNYITDWALFSCEIFVNWRVKFELLGTLWGFKSNDDACYDLVSWSQIIALLCF